ncbi:MAG: DUF2029 domain-containing protein [Myxococcales bacterium]|nr:MAG: DUF2029 domain-containing protein [Myxococcales bacterium]
MGRGMSRRAWALVAAVFILSRAWLLFAYSPAYSDLRLYFQFYQIFTDVLAKGGDFFATIEFEYPPLALPAIVLPGSAASLFGPVTEASYGFAFRTAMLLADLALLLLMPRLVRALRPEADALAVARGTAAYLVLPLAAPDLVYDRLDLAVALGMALSLAALAGGRRRSGVFLLGVTAAFKLAPLLIAAPVGLYLWATCRSKREAFIEAGCGLVGLIGGFAPFLAASGSEVLRFLHYQTARGLQIESLPASLGLLAGRFGFPARAVEEARAISVVFAGSERLGGMWTLAGVAALLALAFYGWRRRAVFADRRRGFAFLTAMSLLFLGLGVAASKVFSPQYLLWLLPFAALVPVEAKSWRIAVGAFFLVLLLTRLVFPHFLVELVTLRPSGVWLLIARNLVFVSYLVLLFRSLRAGVSDGKAG